MTGHTAKRVVQEHREQHQDADIQAREIGVEGREVDALVDDGKGDRTHHDPDRPHSGLKFRSPREFIGLSALNPTAACPAKWGPLQWRSRMKVTKIQERRGNLAFDAFKENGEAMSRSISSYTGGNDRRPRIITWLFRRAAATALISAAMSTMATAGSFEGPVDWNFIPIHSALLPDGKVMTFGAQADDSQGGFDFDIWDPNRGTGANAHIKLPNITGFDSFCAGAILQAGNSRLMIAGGRSNAQAAEFAYRNPQAGLARLPSMKYPRYYASLVTLPDGRLLINGGAPSYANQMSASETSEIFTPGVGWFELPGTANSPMRRGDEATTGNPFWYPHVYPVGNDEVFMIAGKFTYRLNYSGGGSVSEVRPYNALNYGASSTGLLIRPGIAMQIGGGAWANYSNTQQGSDIATIFDLRTRNVTTRDTKMAFKRQWPTAVVLPNGEVLVVGGAEGNNTTVNVANTAEIYNYDTDKWRADATMKIPRLYHSTAILMKDGRVLVGGGGAPGPIAGRNAEIYTPDYLLDGKGVPTIRPSILSGPSKVALGQIFQISANKPIRRVTLVKTGAVTHGYNTDQRFFEAAFTAAGSTYSVTFPNDAVNATPGLYMVFAFDEQGTPSVGKYVRLPSPIGDDGSDFPSDVPTSPAPTGIASSPAQAESWRPCAAEGELCKFDGWQTVRFGSNGKYVSRLMSNAAWCDTATIGDPTVGGVRSCDVQTALFSPGPSNKMGGSTNPTPKPTPTPAPTPQPTSSAGWMPCVGEGQLCKFEGWRTVRFGANGQFVSRVMNNAAWCDVATMGNPNVGGQRTCELQVAGTNPAPTPTPTPTPQPTSSAGWVPCVGEGQLCKFEGWRTVRFGANGQFVSRVMNNAAWCDNATFGDPIPGIVKACELAR